MMLKKTGCLINAFDHLIVKGGQLMIKLCPGVTVKKLKTVFSSF